MEEELLDELLPLLRPGTRQVAIIERLEIVQTTAREIEPLDYCLTNHSKAIHKLGVIKGWCR
jgi:hypothetical protein